MDRSPGSASDSGTPGGPKADRAPDSSRGSSASDEGSRDSSKQRAGNDERSSKNKDKQAGDRDSQDKNRHAKDEDHGSKSKSSDRADRSDHNHNDKASSGASAGAEGKSSGPRGSITSVSPEQKTRVRAAFASHRVAPARDIGVSVNVGVKIPRSVHIYAVPEPIIAIVPEYRDYEYFMIDEDHVAIVDPDTLEVVDIIVVA